MKREQVRRVPVLDGDRLAGRVSEPGRSAGRRADDCAGIACISPSRNSLWRWSRASALLSPGLPRASEAGRRTAPRLPPSIIPPMRVRGVVLVAEDDQRVLRSVTRGLRERGFEVVEAAGVREARRRLAERVFDGLVVDNSAPEMAGLELTREIVAESPRTPDRPQILLMTEPAALSAALEAMRLGALGYVVKPVQPDELAMAVERGLELQERRAQIRYLMAERDEEFNHYVLLGSSAAIQDVQRRIERVAQSKSTVLITGEVGTGKETIARAIHHNSAGSDRPLIKVKCAGVGAAALESALFGHVRGAVADSTWMRKGRFALADGGTIFLDEVGVVRLPLQAKLLRVLTERAFEPLGASRPEAVDVRLIAATNRPLQRLVAEGAFLEDLFYRLNVIPLAVPPLRERPEDIPILVEHFVHRYRQRIGKPVERVEPRAMEALVTYPWPGNVRELAQAIERAVFVASGPILTLETIAPVGGPPTPGPRSLALHENVGWAERQTIERALEAAGGVKKDAAHLLGLSQRALSYYLRKHGLD
jgi:two-component system response regulator AtoC